MLALGIRPTAENQAFLKGIVNPNQPTLSSGPSDFSTQQSGNQWAAPAAPQASSGQVSSVTVSQNPANSATAAGNLGTGGGSYHPGQSLSGGLLEPITGGIQSAQSDIERLASQFRSQAGPSRTFEGIGGQGTLERAIAHGASRDDFGAAKGLLGASYGGPAGLSQEDLSRISGSFAGLQGQAEGLRSGSGLQAALTNAVPGLTPGQARMEAQRLRYDPGFQEEAARSVRNVAQLNQTLQSEAQSAADFAASRKGEEQSIAEKARSFLVGQKDTIARDLESQVEAKKAEEKALADQFAKLRETGSVEDLPAEYMAQVSGSAGRSESAQARAAYDEIMARYDGRGPQAEYDLSAFGPLERIQTRRGREWYGMRDTEGNLQDIRKIPGLDKNTERALVERQRELEKLFGSDLGRKADKEKTPFRDVANLEFRGGEDFAGNIFESGDFRPYASFQPAGGISVGNLASDAQVETYNQISALLDEADMLERDGNPFQAGKIALDVDRYLSDEQARLDERSGKLDAEEKAWHKKLKKLRNRYKESQGGVLGDISQSILGDPALGAWGSRMGQSGVTGDVGGLIGGGIEGPFVGLAGTTGAGTRGTTRGIEASTGALGAGGGGGKKRRKREFSGIGSGG